MATSVSSDNAKTPAMRASQTFDRILQTIQKSNLNFVLQLSPYSANISLKKSLVTNKSGTVCLPPEVSCDIITHEALAALEAKIKLLKEEKDDETKAYKQSTEILEQKVKKAEANNSKLFEEKRTDAEACRKQIKHPNDEINANKKEIFDLKKVVKEKDKVLYRISNKCENLESTVKRVKTENSSLKKENKKLGNFPEYVGKRQKLGRSEIIEHRKKALSKNISLIASAGDTTLEYKSSDISPVNSIMNTTPCNNNNCDTVKYLACSQLSSPHTPPGPPPATAARLSGMSSPASSPQRAIASASPGLKDTCQANNSNIDAATINIVELIDEEPSDKKQNL